MHEYVFSEEMYKGFLLRIIMTDLSGNMRYHKSCHVYKGQERVAIGKHKKEIKELIDGGYIK